MPDPDACYENPEALLDRLEELWKWENFVSATQEEWIWATYRLAQFLKHLILFRYGGRIYVQDDPEEPSFLHYLISYFEKDLDPSGTIDPAEIGIYYTQNPPGRSLIQILNEVFAVAKAHG